MQCIKILINQMYGRSLWLDKEYPICVVDIQRLIGIFVVISTTFQTSSKRGKKIGDANYYNIFGTQRQGKGPPIDPINESNIKFICYMISGKIM